MIEDGDERVARVVSEYQRRLGGVSDQGVVRLIQAQAVRIASAHARTAELVAELYGRPSMVAQESQSSAPTLTREQMVEQELRAAVRLSWHQAGVEVRTARALDERMFATMIMLRVGAIDWARVQIIAKHATALGDHTFHRAIVDGLSPRQAEERARTVVRQLEEAVLEDAPRLSPARDGRLEQRLGEAVAEIDPLYAQGLEKQSATHRSVSPPKPSSDDPDGKPLKNLWAHLPATEAQAVWRTIDLYARHLRGLKDDRTMEQLRADILTHLILRGHPPMTTADGTPVGDWSKVSGFDRYGVRANIDVTVSLETLLGISDQPGHLAGHGAISAQLARSIAFGAGSVWRRVVTDELGQVVDYGRTRYEPPAPLKEFVQARDRYCRTPWCDRPAGTCDVDHVVPYPAGSTAAHNLQCKCRRCHRMKHEGRWQHEVFKEPRAPGYPAGTVRMISPTGMEYWTMPYKLRLPPRLRRHPVLEAAAAKIRSGSPHYREPPF